MDRRIAIPLLKKVKADILANPDNYVQSDPYLCIVAKMEARKELWFGATNKYAYPKAYKAALNLLGITEEERAALWYFLYWPEKFQKQFNRAKTPQGRANVVGRRIDHFIDTGE